MKSNNDRKDILNNKFLYSMVSENDIKDLLNYIFDIIKIR